MIINNNNISQNIKINNNGDNNKISTIINICNIYPISTINNSIQPKYNRF